MTKIDQAFNLTTAVSSASLLMYASDVYDYSAGGALMVAIAGVIMGLAGFYSLINGDF